MSELEWVDELGIVVHSSLKRVYVVVRKKTERNGSFPEYSIQY